MSLEQVTAALLVIGRSTEKGTFTTAPPKVKGANSSPSTLTGDYNPLSYTHYCWPITAGVFVVRELTVAILSTVFKYW